MPRYVIDLPEGTERSLLEGYLARRREDVHALRTAVQDNALGDARLIGHRLYGSGSAYGAPGISMLGREIETAAAGRNVSRLTDLVDQLAVLLDSIVVPPAD